eukprot:IDg9033t1
MIMTNAFVYKQYISRGKLQSDHISQTETYYGYLEDIESDLQARTCRDSKILLLNADTALCFGDRYQSCRSFHGYITANQFRSPATSPSPRQTVIFSEADTAADSTAKPSEK